jgi:hypothetical protein
MVGWDPSFVRAWRTGDDLVEALPGLGLFAALAGFFLWAAFRALRVKSVGVEQLLEPMPKRRTLRAPSLPGLFGDLHAATWAQRVESLFWLVALVTLPFVFWWAVRHLKGIPRWLQVSIFLVALGMLANGIGGAVRRVRGVLRASAERALARDPRSPVLLIRSFGDDATRVTAQGQRFGLLGRIRLGSFKTTLEQVVADALWSAGPVAGIAKPGEFYPPVGAVREYVGLGDWQARVRDYMRRSCVIAAIMGRTRGLEWELNEVREHSALHRLLLVAPPDTEAASASWEAVRAILRAAIDIGEYVPNARVVRILEADAVLVVCTQQKHSDAYRQALLVALRYAQAEVEPA